LKNALPASKSTKRGWTEIAPELWPMALFAVVVIGLATLLYRETLD
jgi:hypothetical protein